ncbi:hypothetical protein AKJ16_DCAP12690 [Drosera capensis]
MPHCHPRNFTVFESIFYSTTGSLISQTNNFPLILLTPRRPCLATTLAASHSFHQTGTGDLAMAVGDAALVG